MKRIVGFLLPLLVNAGVIAQDVITVCPKGCDHTDVQSAVDAIPGSGSGTVIVSTGTYQGGVIVDGRTVEIRAERGAEVVLDAGSEGRVIHVVDGGSVELNDLILENGLSKESGGGVRAESGTSISIRGCRIRHCVSGANGGGVSVAAGASYLFEDCTFHANRAEGESSNGGGIHVDWIDGSIIDRCRFEANRATLEGGAIYQARGNQPVIIDPFPQIRNSLFVLNDAGRSVAWIEPGLGGCGDPTVLGYMTNCTFFQNRSDEGVCITGSRSAWCGGQGDASDLRLLVLNTIIDNSGNRFPGFDLDDYRFCHLDFLTGQENISIRGVDRGPIFLFEAEGDGKTYFDPRVLPQCSVIDAGGSSYFGQFTIDPGPLDLLGMPRVVDDPDSTESTVGTFVDLGASEYDPAIIGGLPEVPGLDFSIWNGQGDGLSFTDPANWSVSKIADAESLWIGHYEQPTVVNLPPNGKNGASIELGSLGILTGRLDLRSPKSGEALIRIPRNSELPFTSGLYVGVDGPAVLALDEDITLECEFIRSSRARIRLNGATVRVDTLVEIQPFREDVPGPDGLRIATLHGPGVVERPGAPFRGEEFDPLVINGGRIRVDELLTIRGDYLQETGELKFRSRAGDDTGNLDRRVVIEGQASMGGTLVFDIGLNAWQPAVGSCFEVVNAMEGFVPGEDTFDYVITRWSGDTQNRFFVVSNTPCGGLASGTGESIYATVVSLDDLLSQNESLQSAGVNLEDLLLVDVDGDGFDDLVLSIDVGSSAGQVVVLLNEGLSGGGWQGFQEYGGSGSVVGVTVGVGPRGLDAGYFDAGSSEGGNLDLVVANEGDGSVSVIANDGVGPGDLTLSILQTIDLVDGPEGDGTNPLPIDICVKNYDQDACGLSDLAITCLDNSIWTLQNVLPCGGLDFVQDPLANTIRVALANPKPITSFVPGLGGGSGGGKRNDPPRGSSKDDDSVSDGVVNVPASGSGFTLSWTRHPIVGGGRPVDLARADVNGDGIDDVVTVNFEDDSFAILPGIGPGGYGGAILVELEEGFVEPSSVALGDLDGDTDIDIAFVCRRVITDERVVRIVRNTFAETGLEGWVFEGDLLLSGQEPYRIRSTDVDDDGIDDLVALTEVAGLVGGVTSGIGTVGPAVETSCIGDINGDAIVNGGDLALVLSGWGPCSGSCSADFDGNGLIDGGDLAQVLAVWGPCSPGQ